MIAAIENTEKLIATATELAETKIELAKLRVTKKVSVSLGSILAMIMVLVLSAGALTILSFGLSFLLGDYLGNTSYGFFIVGAVYALVGCLLYVNRQKWVQKPLSDLFIDKITGNDD